MAVFDSQFTDQRVGGVRDSFSLDAAPGYITAGGEFGVSDRGVDSDDGRHAVVTECRKKVFQWVELPATEPYTLDASMRYRYELVMSARGWIISEYTATGEC